MAPAPKVAVVGGGFAGAACSWVLSKKGATVSVFDMGKRAPGGRASTRTDPPGQQYDYGVQFFRASSPAMRRLVSEWVSAGVAAEWRPRLGLYDAAQKKLQLVDAGGEGISQTAEPGFFGCLQPQGASGGSPLYVGVPGNSSPVSHLLLGPHRQSPATGGPGESLSRSGVGPGGARGGEVLRLNQGVKRVQYLDGRWKLGGREDSSEYDLGEFDILVLADNQFCRAGSPGSVTFDGAPPALSALADQVSAAARVPLFSLMIAWGASAPTSTLHAAAPGASRPSTPATPAVPPRPVLPADAVAVVGGEAVQWISNDSSKPGRPRGGGYECWVAVTTEQFAAQLLAEEPGAGGGGGREGAAGVRRLPAATAEYRAAKAEQIWAAMQPDLRAILGCDHVPRPPHLTAHRWGSALTSPALGVPAAADASGHWAACGDFCSGPGVESAVTSGIAAAEAVAAMLGLTSDISS